MQTPAVPPPDPPRPLANNPRCGLRRRTRRHLALACAAGAVALAGGAAGSALTLAFHSDGIVEVHSSAPTRLGTPFPTEALAKVAMAALPSVVTVTVGTPAGAGVGSGIILTTGGIVLTNAHVVDAAGTGGGITVTFDGGRTAAARLLGQDPAADIAVLRATASGLTPAVLGTASSLHPGDAVMAIGSPLGLDSSVSVGVVSALHRRIGDPEPGPRGQGSRSDRSLTDAIQTDTAINPGNSGGPLLDDTGKVVGITTAIATTGGGYLGQQPGSIGIGFAIPIDTAYRAARPMLPP